jgi:isopenicillin N synthase-like dioxygenase
MSDNLSLLSPQEQQRTTVLPVVDIQSSEPHITLRRACVEHGFFYLVGHDISPDLVQTHMDIQRQFFALPLGAKMRIKADSNNRGYTPMGNETLDEKNSIQGDTHEGCYFGLDVPPDSQLAKTFPLHGPNQWPDEGLIPNYKSIVEEYIAEMRKLGMRVLKLLSLSLNLPPDYFDPFFQHRPMIALRPLHYAPVKSDPDNGIFAAGAHSDYGMLTFLVTDDEPGLQIIKNNSRGGGEWMDVAPMKGAFICNLGDMLERWTNGVYKSTEHRVINRNGRDRYSAPFFWEPAFDTVVEPIIIAMEEEELNGEGESAHAGHHHHHQQQQKPKYPPITSGEYLLGRYNATHEGFSAK